jgi:hypothetical protein
MVRLRLRSDAPVFSHKDYQYIMERRDEKPKYKVVHDLMKKYKTSSKRIYQIWRGEEASRVLWDQPILNPEDNDPENGSPFNTSSLDLQNRYNVIEKRTRSYTPINANRNNSLVSIQNLQEKISEAELNALKEREIKRDERNIPNLRRLLAD